jgi:hypothetical protein
MAITYTFLTDNTMQLEVAPVLGDLTDVVTRVRYNYVGVNEDGVDGIFAGATPMPLPEDTENYIPFADLTPDEVVAWLEATADITHMQERIAKQIEAKIHPMYEPVPSPWATPEPTPIPPTV